MGPTSVRLWPASPELVRGAAICLYGAYFHKIVALKPRTSLRQV